jgi:uncharacterized RDD family membrane protein YckC
MDSNADARFAPPQAHVADLAAAGPVLAGRGMRFLALIVDLIALTGAAWALGKIPVLHTLLDGQGTPGFSTLNPVSTVAGFTFFVLVQGWSLLTRGQTLGKMLFKLRIVRTDGSKPDA